MKKTILVILLLIGSVIFGAAGGVGVIYYYPQFANITKNETIQTTMQVVEESQTTAAVAKVLPSVVSIVIKEDLSNYYQNGFLFFNNLGTNTGNTNQGLQEVGGGTGFIISADGLILTNRHVVDSSDTAQYSVVLSDGTTYDAQVLAKDTLNDIAVIKIDAQNLPVVELGDSSTLKVGETVIAIGNTLAEYQNSVTKGIISGLDRKLSADYTGLLQTDAAINEGNSGGPLINLAGQVVGVNVAIDRSSNGESIGFAIPVNQAKSDIESVRENGKIIRPMLGVRFKPITEQFAKKNSLPYNYGAIILAPDADTLAIVPGSPADKAGLKIEDIILEVNGTKIDENNTLTNLIGQHKVGDEVTLKVYSDGAEKEVKITLEEMKTME